jgi:thioredoxin
MVYQPLYTLNDIQEINSNNEAVLIYFSSESCSVCKVLKPKIAGLIESEFPKMKLFYVDIEKSPLISGQYRIFTIPTLLVFFDGKEYIRKSRNIGLRELQEEIERPYGMVFEEGRS